MPTRTRKARAKRAPAVTRNAAAARKPSSRKARVKLIDGARMEAAAVTMGQSAEALVGYLSRLDALRDRGLGREALAERAAEAELQTRVLLSTGMDALNEMNDLGLFNDVPTKKELDAFNEITLTDAIGLLAQRLREQMPAQRWDWLDSAGKLVEGVEMRVEVDRKFVRANVKHSGQSKVVRFDPAATPAKRLSTKAFFSAGPDRVYVPTSAIFASRSDSVSLSAPYDGAVAGMAFVREWVYRHARNAAELGPPARTGGGPVLVVIAVVLIVLAIAAGVAAVILEISCDRGSVKACFLAAYFGLASKILSKSAEGVGTASQQQTLQTAQTLMYGTNPP